MQASRLSMYVCCEVGKAPGVRMQLRNLRQLRLLHGSGSFIKDQLAVEHDVLAGEPEKVVTPDNIRSFVIPINWRSHSAQLVVCLE